jgi:hypothetical protein
MNIFIPDVNLALKCPIETLSDDQINNCINSLFKNAKRVYIIFQLPENITKNLYTIDEFTDLFYKIKNTNGELIGLFWKNIKDKTINKKDADKSFAFGIADMYSIKILNDNKHKHAYYLTSEKNILLHNDKKYLIV